MKKFFIIVLLLISSVLYCETSEEKVSVNGYLEENYSFKTSENNEVMANKSKLRLELRKNSSNLSFYSFIDASNDKVLDENSIEVGEAYFEYNSDNWDLKVGKQIYSWGKADGFRIIDVLSPSNLTEFMIRDFDETRIAVNSVKYKYLFSEADLELVWIPSFEKSILPTGTKNPWKNSKLNSNLGYIEVEPENKLSNSEIAGKVSFFYPEFDLSLSAGHLWDNEPVYKIDNGSIIANYFRSDFFGLSLSKPYKSIVFRMEGAYFPDKYQASSSMNSYLEKNMTKLLAGIDYYPGNNLTVSTQILEEYIVNHNSEVLKRENDFTASLTLLKKLFREKLEIGSSTFYNTKDKDLWEKFSMKYDVTNDLNCSAGANIFFGNKGTYGVYDKNDSLWLETRYSF